jgi:hypothetical protein
MILFPTFAANQQVANMEVITIDSQAYKELVSKINAIAKFVVDHQDDDTANPTKCGWIVTKSAPFSKSANAHFNVYAVSG